MIALPYHVFAQRQPTTEPWRAPIWRSFSEETDAERELRRAMTDRSEHAPIVYANLTGPDGSREFVWIDDRVVEVTP